MGSGWSWSRKPGSDDDHAAAAADGWAEIARRIGEQRHDFYVLDEFTYPLKWGWVRRRRRGRGAALPAGRARRDHRTRRTAAAARRRRSGDRDDQGQAPDGRRPQRPARDRMVSAQRPALVIAAPSSGSGKTTIATGLIGALRAGRSPGGAVQGGAGLHRPRLSRAGRGQARAQPGPGAGLRGVDRAAVPARLAGRRHRRGRRRHGSVRRPHRRAGDHPGPRVHRPGRRTPRRPGGPGGRRPRSESEHRCCAARVFDLPSRRARRRGDPQPGRVASPRTGAAPGLRRRRGAGAGGDPAPRRVVGAVAASGSGDRRRAR